MTFRYQARKRDGGTTTGEIEASSQAEARQQIRSQGLFLTALSPIRGGEAGPRAQLGGSTLFGGVAKTDIVLAMSQLTIMCQSGVDLAEALHNIADQCPRPALRAVLERVDADVSSGTSFSESLRKHPQVFDETFLAGIAAGEQTGSIPQVLERLTHLMRNDMRMRSTVWSMLMYPIVLCSVTFIVLNVLIFFVLPQFATVFEDLEKPVPFITQVLLDLGKFVRSHLLLVLGGIGGSAVGLYLGRNAPVVRRTWDYATLHVAVVRNATRALLTGRVFRLLGTMLSSGVPLVDGIRLCRRAAKNSLFHELFEQVERDVLHGEGLGRPLMNASFLPSGAAQMVATAERSGKMGEVLKTVGEYFEDEGERCLRDLIKLAEPAVIVFMGVVVGGIVMSIMIPMLDVSTSSH
jgi:type II secretory pathway component PulF